MTVDTDLLVAHRIIMNMRQAIKIYDQFSIFASKFISKSSRMCMWLLIIAIPLWYEHRLIMYVGWLDETLAFISRTIVNNLYEIHCAIICTRNLYELNIMNGTNRFFLCTLFVYQVLYI